MPDMPRIEVRAARPYLGRALTTSIDREAADVVRQFAELRRWLHAHGRETTGAPFIRYREIEMPHRLAIEACLPIASMAQGSGGIVADDLPAGRYAVLEHVGPLDGLVAADEHGFTVRPEGTTEDRTIAYGDVERVRTVFDWGPAPKPGKAPGAGAPKKPSTSKQSSPEKKAAKP